MSIGNLFVRANNGLYYQDPVFRGVTEKGNRWFVCFDEDDPPELVVELTHGPENPTQILKDLKIPNAGLSKGGVSGRSFEGKSAQAIAYDFSCYDRIPPPTNHRGVFPTPENCPGMNRTMLDYGRWRNTSSKNRSTTSKNRSATSVHRSATGRKESNV